MSIITQHFPNFKNDLRYYTNSKSLESESTSETFIRNHLLSRVAAPMLAIRETVKGLADLPLCALEHIIGGIITLNTKQLVIAAKYVGGTVIVNVAFPIIGLIGTALPREANRFGEKLTDWSEKEVKFTPRYSEFQERIMAVVLAITGIFRVGVNFIADTTTTVVLETASAAVNALAKAIYGFKGALFLSKEARIALNIRTAESFYERV